MPRRQSIARKTKYQTESTRVSDRFRAKLMRDGKQTLSDRILRQALARAEFQAKRPGLEVLEAALRNATPIIEVKPRRVGGATYQVPIEIVPALRTALAFRWIIEFSRKRGEKTMEERLAGEILDCYSGQGSTIKRREDTHKMAEANKAFAHFRF